MDAIIKASSSMKDAINYVGDKYDLPVGWLNSDFTHTSSYSPKLVQYSDGNINTIFQMSSEFYMNTNSTTIRYLWK